ncbi:MAG: GNAT family N-acetyltransferase [Spirochaetota bacterium]|jgi:ribosomal protein S18 acetylase RimI-like enzyme|nr:GNAT family N-acetyltransferase [Spirochaetota bacterium]
MEIDFFRSEDYNALADLTKRSFALSAYTVDRHLPRPLYGQVFFQTVVTRALRENSNACLVARKKDVPLGYIIYGVDLDLSKKFGATLATIILFCVDAAYRRQGVGRSLLARAISLLKSRGVDLLTVGTDCNNLPALTLYQQAGFITRLTWGAWRLYPAFASANGSAREGKPEYRCTPWAGEENALELCRQIERPLSYFRDSRLSLRGLVHLRKLLAANLRKDIADQTTRALIASGTGFWGERPLGLLAYEEEGAIEKFYNLETLEKRVYRVSDVIIARNARGQGIAGQLVHNFCAQALPGAFFIEAWAAMDDWAAMNVLAKNHFRPAHIAVVLHLWL